MRIIAVEEHFSAPDLVARIPSRAIAERGWPAPPELPPFLAHVGPRLTDLADGRIARMDAAGIDLQLLSAAGPGAELLPGPEGVQLARDYNDMLARAIGRHPGRLAGFAHLPMRDPAAAADELERTVLELGFKGAMINGTTNGAFLDDPHFAPILARAEALGQPLYLHPHPPPPIVRSAYFDGLAPGAGAMLAMGAWGWHVETGLHVVRLAVSGTLDRYPGLTLIVGHMGELLPTMLERLDDTLSEVLAGRLARPVSATILDHVIVTTSGFTSHPSFRAAYDTFGPDRMMFGTDYPYSDELRQTAFLRDLPVPSGDVAKIAHGTAERLFGL